MNIKLKFNTKPTNEDLIVLPVLQKSSQKNQVADISNWDKELQNSIKKISSFKFFKAQAAGTFYFSTSNGQSYLAYGLGKDPSSKELRNISAKLFTELKNSSSKVFIDFKTLYFDSEKMIEAVIDGLQLKDYLFEKYLSEKKADQLKIVTLNFLGNKQNEKIAVSLLKKLTIINNNVLIARDLGNDAPNVLTAPHYANTVKKMVAGIEGVTIKILNKKQIQKEKMNLLLAVNAGSAHEPRVVHLTYTPKKVNKKTQHIALVGKGLTFDAGGYSIKPSGSMLKMKYDMCGSATVFAAFKALAELKTDRKISCFLGMTDNMISSEAIVPDTIVTARNGKTVEILNTDAEGRLVLADLLDYACDVKPNQIIDAATLTGAVLVSLSEHICGIMSNNNELSQNLLNTASESDEYMWELPLISEFEKAMKSSPIADLLNWDGSRFGGTSKAAMFLKQFVKNDTPWAHLDIAGVATDQKALDYCPAAGASGLIVKTIINHILKA